FCTALAVPPVYDPARSARVTGCRTMKATHCPWSRNGRPWASERLCHPPPKHARALDDGVADCTAPIPVANGTTSISVLPTNTRAISRDIPRPSVGNAIAIHPPPASGNRQAERETLTHDPVARSARENVAMDENVAGLESMPRVDVNAVLTTEREALLQILSGLDGGEWNEATECPAWTVAG